MLFLASDMSSFAQTAPTPLAPIVIQHPEQSRPKPALAKKTAANKSRATRAARAPAPPLAAPGVAVAPAPASAFAQRTGESRAEATSLQLGKPDQSGSRLGLTPLETPASVGVISSETIRERGEHRVIDAVTENAVGFTAIPAPGNGGTSLATRGFTGQGSVMQLYDGTRLYVGAGTVTFPFDTWSAERIEVLSGPASVLYGEGAIGGIVNVISKQPIMTRFGGDIEATLGAYGTRRIGIDVGGPIDTRWGYRFTYSGNASDGYVSRGNFSNNAFSGAVRFEPQADLNFTLSENYGDQRPARYFGVPLVNGQIDPSLRFNNYNVANADIHYADNYTQLKAQWIATPGITVDNTIYYLESHRHYYDVENYAFSPTTNLVTRTNYIEIYHTENQIGDRLATTFRGNLFGWKNALVVGGDANEIYFKRTSNTPYPGSSSEPLDASNPGTFINVTPLGTHPEFSSRTSQASAFAEDRLEFSEKLAFVVGGRFEAPNIHRTDLVANTSFDKDFRVATYRAGVVYTPLPGLAFYGQYATGIDGVGNLISLAVSQKDFSLSPGQQVEIGVKDEFWGGRGAFTLAGYQIIKKDLLTVDPVTLATNQVGEQSSRGVEAAVSVRFAEAWRINANIAVLRAKYDNFVASVSGKAVSYAGNIPIDVPQQVANLSLAYAFARDWEARVAVQYVGKIYGDSANAVPLPAFAVVNAQLEWRPRENISLTGRIYNIFDTVYAMSGTATQAVLGPPRTAELALNYRF